MADTDPKPDFERILAQGGWVRKLAHKLVFDPSMVDDVVQETWVAALEKPPPKIFDYHSWLAGVTRNVSRHLDRGERRRVRREQASTPRGPSPSTEDLIEKADLHKRVVQAVLELKEPYRSTLLMRYFEDLSAKQIEGRMGIPGSTVRNRIKRALDLLRERFDGEMDGDRRAWCLTLIPLALPKQGAPLIAGGSATLSSGVLAMTFKGIAAATTLVALGFFAEPALRQAAGGSSSAALKPPVALSIAAQNPTLSVGQKKDQRVPVKKGEKEKEKAKAVRTVQGQVKDLEGKPISGVKVFIGGQPNPFEGAAELGLHLEGGREFDGELREWNQIPPEALQRRGVVLGRHVDTDAQGRYSVKLEEAERVFVCLSESVEVEREFGQCGWHTTPAKDVNFTARRVPTSTVEMRVKDETTGKNLQAFRLAISEREGTPRGIEGRFATQSGVLRTVVALSSDAPTNVWIYVREPVWAQTSKQVLLTPGKDEEIEILVQSGAGFVGTVVDPDGNPLSGALVFWGDTLRMRNGSPFHPYRTESIPDGVRSDALGSFTLPGHAPRVSAWHPDFSPVTRPTAQAGRLALQRRGAIQGVLVDAAGAPLAGREVGLDRAREVLTDEAGRFSFEAIEAGLHFLRLPERQSRGVSVAAGETVEVPLGAEIESVTISLQSGGRPYLVPMRGLFLGLGRTFRIGEFGVREGAFTARTLPPDRYVLMSHEGHLGVFTVEGPQAVLEFGTLDLSVRAQPGARVFLAPEMDNPMVDFYARRMARETPESGVLSFAPLTPGRYRVGVLGRDEVHTVSVAEQGTQFSIP